MQRKILALIFAVEWNAGSVYSSNHSMEFFENWMYMKKNLFASDLFLNIAYIKESSCFEIEDT